MNDSLLREELCEWAVNYIRNDDQVDIEDPDAWHYLVEISNIDEMVEPGVFLFGKEDMERAGFWSMRLKRIWAE